MYVMVALNLAVFCSLAVLPSSSRAQDQGPSATVQQPPSPDEMAELLAKKLNLSDDQKAQISPIIAERQQSLRGLRADTSMRPRQKRRKVKSIFEDSDKKINAMLNEDQRKEYAELEQQMRAQMKERMQS
jgi:protein CpxP